MSATSNEPTTSKIGAQRGRVYRPRKRDFVGAAVDRPLSYKEDSQPSLTDVEAKMLALCDGNRSLQDIARAFAKQNEFPESDVSAEAWATTTAAVQRFFRLGLLETIEEAALRSVLDYHGSRIHNLRIVDICTGDFFTAVRLNDGSQGAAINFNNVSGPHRTAFDHCHYDDNLTRLMETDPLLTDAFLRQPALDYLGQSVRVAILNALSCGMLTPERLRTEHALELHDGFLDLASFIQPGDNIAMIGCTGNYSCAAVGKVANLGTVYFSDFEYVEPFKAGIEDCIRQHFVHPEKVVFSAGDQNEVICGKADVVVMIADTLCTNTLDELLLWSLDAREVLITGRSYVMDPIHLFDRGASGITTQRIIQQDYIGFVRDKLRRGEFGFTDPLVTCFERMYAIRR